jgi:hypothetical protein
VTTDWAPPTTRIRSVPNLAGLTLSPGIRLGSNERERGRFDQRLWLHMRRLLPPEYWYAWLAVPRAQRLPIGGPAVQNYNSLITNLIVLADFLGLYGVQITVGQAALWCCALPGRPQGEQAEVIAAWQDPLPTGNGWLQVAAGLDAAEYATRPPLSPRVLHALAALRGHCLPDVQSVPTVARPVDAQAA